METFNETTLSKYTIKKLKSIASALDVKGRSKMTKRELIGAIVKAKNAKIKDYNVRWYANDMPKYSYDNWYYSQWMNMNGVTNSNPINSDISIEEFNRDEHGLTVHVSLFSNRLVQGVNLGRAYPDGVEAYNGGWLVSPNLWKSSVDSLLGKLVQGVSPVVNPPSLQYLTGKVIATNVDNSVCPLPLILMNAVYKSPTDA